MARGRQDPVRSDARLVFLQVSALLFRYRLALVNRGVEGSSPFASSEPPRASRSATRWRYRPAIIIAMPTAEIYTLLLAGLLIGGVLWVVTRFIDRD